MEETISRMAGSENGSARTVAELTTIARLAGRPVRQRTTTYTGTPRRLVPAPGVGTRLLPLTPA
jgi:FO synthase